MFSLKEEKRLVKKAREDKNEFAPLYKKYHSKILNFFNFRVGEMHIAEELTSKVFEKALVGIDNFQWQGVPFSAWLFRIARNTLIDHYRAAEKEKTKKIGLELTPQIEDKGNVPSEQVKTMMSEDLLYQILAELPSREKDIIYMKFFDGYTNRVISNLLNVSETNVGTIIYRTLRKLRSMYKTNQGYFNSRD